MTKKHIKDYINTCKVLLKKTPVNGVNEIVETLYQAYLDEKQVFIMGNGGSASTASHLACDLAKGTAILFRPRFRVISLNDNVALMTAISNDFRYEKVFKEQLANLLNPEDIVIAITASGNSPNILEAVKYAKSQKATIIGIIGFDGGKLKEIADKAVVIPDYNYGRVESIHSTLGHLITECLKQKFKSSTANRAVFLDRDGVISENRDDYVKNWGEFEFLPRAKEAIKLLKEEGYLVIIVSNQQAIGKRLMSKADLDDINKRMIREVKKSGGKIDGLYYCPHLKEKECSCRKPKTGMLREAIKKFDIDVPYSFLVGDADTDIIAGKKLGLTTVFLRSGRHSEDDVEPYDPDYIFDDLFEFSLTVAKK